MARPSRAGFTLTELMVASLLGVAVIASMLWSFSNQNRAYVRQRTFNEMNQNVRAAIDMMARDIRMAGYGLPVDEGSLDAWLDWGPGLTNALTVHPGGSASAPDAISMAAAFDAPVSSLASDVSAGATVLQLASGTGSQFNTSDRKVIYIGRLETARIVSVAGDQLTISTHPTSTGEGLDYAYPAGTPIERVEIVTYSCHLSTAGFPYRPFLMRDNHLGVLTNDLQKMVAVGIENLQATASNVYVRITVTGKAEDPEHQYTHPTEGDHYRRTTRSAAVTPRNLL